MDVAAKRLDMPEEVVNCVGVLLDKSVAVVSSSVAANVEGTVVKDVDVDAAVECCVSTVTDDATLVVAEVVVMTSVVDMLLCVDRVVSSGEVLAVEDAVAFTSSRDLVVELYTSLLFSVVVCCA